MNLWNYYERAAAWAASSCGDEEAARDAVVAVFADLESGKIVYDPARGNPARFLYVTVRNRARDMKPNRLAPMSDEFDARPDGEGDEHSTYFESLLADERPQTTPDEELEVKQMLRDINASLTETEKDVFALYTEGHTTDEIMAALDLTYDQTRRAITGSRAKARHVVLKDRRS